MSPVAPVSIGLASLGDVVVPVFPRGLALPAESAVAATTYRPEQRSGVIGVVAYRGERPGGGLLLARQSLATRGERAGEDLITVVLRATETGGVEVRAAGKEGGADRRVAFRVPWPADPPVGHGALPGEPPDAGEGEWQGSMVLAEVLLRWFRGLLRERQVRHQTREDAFALRGLPQAVEDAIAAGEREALGPAVQALRDKAREIAGPAGIPLFPEVDPLVLLPDP